MSRSVVFNVLLAAACLVGIPQYASADCSADQQTVLLDCSANSVASCRISSPTCTGTNQALLVTDIVSAAATACCKNATNKKGLAKEKACIANQRKRLADARKAAKGLKAVQAFLAEARSEIETKGFCNGGSL